MKKLTVELGSFLESKFLHLPKEVPVFPNFESRHSCGKALVKEEEGELVAEVELTDKGTIKKLIENSDLFGCGISAIIKEQEGNIIKKADLISISIIPKNPVKSQKVE